MTIQQMLGFITLASVLSLATADPRIISTYKASESEGKPSTKGDRSRTGSGTSGSGEESSSDSSSTSTSTSSGSTSGSTSGTQTSGSGTAYTLPSNFNFNCNTRNANADAIENGRRAYLRLNCSVCHSSNGHGGTMGPSLVGEGDEVAEAVTQGEGEGMPAFKKYLCPNDLADLKAYVDSLGSKTSPDFTDWWVPNPPARWADSQ